MPHPPPRPKHHRPLHQIPLVAKIHQTELITRKSYHWGFFDGHRAKATNHKIAKAPIIGTTERKAHPRDNPVFFKRAHEGIAVRITTNRNGMNCMIASVFMTDRLEIRRERALSISNLSRTGLSTDKLRSQGRNQKPI